MKAMQTFIKGATALSLLALTTLGANAATLPVSGDFHADKFAAKIVSVDQKNHVVVLEGEGGDKVALNVPESSSDLAKLKAGDVVDTTVIRSVAVGLDTDIDKSAPTASTTSGESKASDDNPNVGREAFRQVNVQLKIKHIDLKKNEVTFEGPKGQQKVIAIDNPDIQARLKELKVDQSIRVTYTDAIQINVRPAK
ncbi:hypothetical protein MUA02_14650 [Enterobacteriaceae bacterium H20N1]|uniref:Uncharacterized protein n=1 Tax=Dryocola boscaweniae TaxID=2925397 RepID=A0A9X2WBN5_9ENTR|nr:hypothetical protein [Dryocola boscaweniae]MCT4703094.1 hypothetical protein [Dryocola boscaweniae]MCT4715137.1 hypothetical protein [Dryocola boscaweniae]MCT4720262.1 hypothetical protein [Dryocola boscaweniae]